MSVENLIKFSIFFGFTMDVANEIETTRDVTVDVMVDQIEVDVTTTATATREAD